MLSQEELKKEILSQKKNIIKIINDAKNTNKFTLCVKHDGQYQIIASKRKLIPGANLNTNTAHYTAEYLIDSEKVKKKRLSAKKITENLIDELFKTIERTTWYFGN